MEKQKFLMEVLELSNNQGKTLEPVALDLIREAIKYQAKNGVRAYNLPSNQIYITINGVNLIIGSESIKTIITALKEDGFEVDEFNGVNGYTSIKW